MGHYYLSRPWNVPLCFHSGQEFARWREMARQNKGDLGKSWYCADCTQEYHDRMAKVGKCEFPETTFSVVGGFVTGKRKVIVIKEIKHERKRKGSRQGSIQGAAAC